MAKIRSTVTVGADPEFFLRDRDTGSPVPVCGLLGGTKNEPLMVGGYGVQEDNVMCEYTVPPVENASMFRTVIEDGRNQLMEYLNGRHGGRFEYDISPGRLFPLHALETAQAQMFGCLPDYDAYQMGVPNPRIEPGALITERGAWRFSGGHVHIGYKHLLNYELPEYIAAQFADLFIGLQMVRHDKQGERRKYYGSPGRYRPKPYGIEYRTLSNRWTADRHRTEVVGHCAIQLGTYLTRTPEAGLRKIWSEIPWVDVRRAIANEDIGLASSITAYCSRVGVEV